MAVNRTARFIVVALDRSQNTQADLGSNGNLVNRQKVAMDL
jgi:hypothetical protein